MIFTDFEGFHGWRVIGGGATGGGTSGATFARADRNGSLSSIKLEKTEKSGRRPAKGWPLWWPPWQPPWWPVVAWLDTEKRWWWWTGRAPRGPWVPGHHRLELLGDRVTRWPTRWLDASDAGTPVPVPVHTGPPGRASIVSFWPDSVKSGWSGTLARTRSGTGLRPARRPETSATEVSGSWPGPGLQAWPRPGSGHRSLVAWQQKTSATEEALASEATLR